MIAVTREMIFLWMQCSILISHAFLAIDLVLVIKNPFYPKNWRVIKIYAPVSILVGAIFGITMSQLYNSLEGGNDVDLEAYEYLRSRLRLIIVASYLLVTVSCNIYSYYRLSRPGISKKMRFRYFFEQARYSLVGQVLTSIYVGIDLYVLITGNNFFEINKFIDNSLYTVLPIFNTWFFFRSRRR